MRFVAACDTRGVTLAAASAAHGKTAGLAELGALRHHATRYFRPIRNEFGAKPQGVWRAGLLGIHRALGPGAIGSAKNQRTDQQRRTVDEAFVSHVILPGLKSDSAPAGR